MGKETSSQILLNKETEIVNFVLKWRIDVNEKQTFVRYHICLLYAVIC